MKPQAKKQTPKIRINSSVFLILFVIIPGALIWFFLGRDVDKIGIVPLWALYTIVIGFATLIFVISATLIWFDILEFQGLNLIVPMTIIFSTITLTYSLSSVLRFSIVIVLVISLTMITMYITNKNKGSKDKEIDSKRTK